METKPVDALKSEHRRLDDEIQLEYAKHDRDDAHLNELKRQKLRLKDQIAHVSGSA